MDRMDQDTGPLSASTDVTQTGVLPPQLGGAVRDLREALSVMLLDVGADLHRPQEISRQLQLDKSLTWKLSRILGTGGVQETLQYLPGDAAMQLVFRAVEKAGGKPKLRRATEDKLRSLHEVIRSQIGDKSTLELVVDALPDPDGERLVVSRKLAFRGNSAIWGVQARVRLNTVLMRPNEQDPEMIDVAIIGAWIDFRRLRHDAKWTIFRRNTFQAVGLPSPEQPLDPNDTDSAMLLRQFCSPNLPAINSYTDAGVIYMDLGPSDVGNSGAFTVVFASVTRALGSRYGDAGSNAAFPAGISAPVEHLQFDMLFHRDCGFAMQQNTRTVARLMLDDSVARHTEILPIPLNKHDLGREPPRVDSPLVPNYTEMVAHAVAALKWDLRAFVGTRYIMEYPPFPSSVVVSCPLDQRPGTGTAG